MNGHFEKNGSWPFSTAPAGGWGNPNPTGLWSVIDIRNGTVVSTGHADAVAAARAIPQG